MLRSTLLIVICALASTVAFGQDEMAQYQPLMKAVVASFGPLRMAVMAKDTAGAAAAATKLEGTFDQVLAFWQKKGASDAVEFATNARDAAKAIAGSTDAAAQAASMMKLQQQCGGCHMAHRMGAAPNFMIH
jgi:cytochrome c556